MKAAVHRLESSSRPGRNPSPPTAVLEGMLNAFIRLTLIVALAIVAFFVAIFLLKVLVVAAVIAALVLGILFLTNLARRRKAAPITRYRP